MSPRVRNVLLTTTALFALAPVRGIAGPDGPTVVGGAATVSGAGTAAVTINQGSDRAIVNWNTFNIGKGETTTFVQPSSSAVILNRVTGGFGPSDINGTLNANGRVFLINRDGVLIGSGASINTAGFLATTSDIKDRDFLAGRYNFHRSGAPDASIVNLGHITASSGGFAALVAPGVRNSGTITATLGSVSLASGHMFTLDMYGDKLIQLGVNDKIAGQVKDVATGQALTSLVTNEGKIRANGGRIELTAVAARHVVDSVINNKGVLEANSIGHRNGMIVLGAATGASKPAHAPVQTVKVSGKISVAGRKHGTTGGTVVVTGENIQVAGAKIDASGKAGGGKVLIGGDWGGGKPTSGLVQNASAQLENFPIATATTVNVDGATTINASARDSGNGGKVVLWSDTLTTFAGVIEARGGPLGGDGGFVETSSHDVLAFTGTVDTLAPRGTAGTLLLDPRNVLVETTGSDTMTNNGGTFTPNQDTSTIKTTTLQAALATGNVVLTTGGTGSPGAQTGDVTFDINSSLTWSQATTLTVSAFHDITFMQGAGITSTGAGSLILRADNSANGSGTVNFYAANGIDFRGSTGTVSFYYNPSPASPGANKYENATSFTGNVSTNPSLPGQFTAYMLVNSAADLQAVGFSNKTRSGTYALGTNIDATSFTGFSAGTTFTGTFDGNGGLGVNQTISNQTAELFPVIGSAGVVRNLSLTNVAINGGGAAVVGAIAGSNSGTIRNVVLSSGTVNGGANSVAGGLVGSNLASGIISNSSANATVVGTAAGGIAGDSLGTISTSFATGTATGQIAGGLVGVNENTGSISESFAGGAVNGTLGGAVGGLVGSNGGRITNSYAVGTVTGTVASATGGLVGIDGSGTITSSYSTGLVTGGLAGITGGLIGSVNSNTTVVTSYWDTQTSGQKTSAGGTGLTTAQLQAALPAGFDSSVWSIVPSFSYPYLKWQFAPGSTPQVVSGIAYSDRGVTPVAGGTVSALLSGSPLNSALTGGAVTTGANGYYYYLLNPGTISPPAMQLLTYTAAGGQATGATYRQNAPGSVAGLDIYGGYLRGVTDVSTVSALNAGLAVARGNNAGLLSGLVNREIDASAASFTIDTLASHTTLVLNSTGSVTQTAPINVTNLALLGTGANYTLTDGGNQIGRLAANTGSVSLTNGSALSIGTVAGTSGVTATGAVAITDNAGITIDQPISAGTLILSSTGTVSQTGATISASNVALLGPGGTYTLTNAGNHIGTLAANTGSVSLADGTALTVGTVAGTSGATATGTVAITANPGISIAQTISAGTLTLTSTGPVTQSAGITANGLALLGAGGTYTLTNAGNQVGTLAANTGSVSLANSHTLDIGSSGGTNGVTTTGAFTLDGNGNTVTASGAVGVGGTFTLAGGFWTQNMATLPAFSAADFRVTGGSFLRVTGGDGSAGSPYRLADVYGLQGVVNTAGSSALLNKNYVLANDINASTASAWNNGSGFAGGGTFTGVFDGAGHAIDHFTATHGLFGFVGAGATVQNLRFTSVSISAASDTAFLGALAGENDGTVSNVSVSGTISGGAHSGVIAGGLVGQNRGTITLATSAVNVSVGDASSGSSINAAGGLVGTNLGMIAQSSASGAINGGSNNYLGGLVGQNGLNGTGSGAIASSFATGAVSIQGARSFAGGLAGGQQTAGSTITNSYATGNVTASVTSANFGNTIGGLVGTSSGTITDSQAFGNVNGGAGFFEVAGGLVGSNFGTIAGTSIPTQAACVSGASSSCAAGSVSILGDGEIGGLVGINGSSSSSAVTSITNSFATGNVGGIATVNFDTSQTMGGLVGVNNIGGTITNSHATGAVNGAPATFSTDGGLAGTNSGGTITNSYATGPVTAGNTFSFLQGAVVAGGLVGNNDSGLISTSYATGQVTGGLNSIVGGLAGRNRGQITQSYSTASVTGAGGSFVGGFVGFNFGNGGASGIISGSYATGNVSGGTNSIAGGFFGVNLFGAIDNSYVTGAVTGGTHSTVGGFGGLNMGTVAIAAADGAVTGGDNSFVGGFVGVNFAVVDPKITFPTGTISKSFTLGPATGGANSFVAGFAAINVGSLDQTFAAGLVTAGPGSTTGGLVASNTFSYTLPSTIVALDPPGTATNSYWDRQTTGQTASAGGTGVDTAQLSTVLPSGFDPGTWGIIAGSYPFLPGFSGIDTTTGTAVLPAATTTTTTPATTTTAATTATPAAAITIVLDTLVAPSALLAMQQLTQEPALSSSSFAEVVNTQAIQQQQVQQAQQQAQQPPSGQPQPGATPLTGFGAAPIRLNVGEGRYFYLPPPGETRLVQGEAVLQLPCNTPEAAFAAATRQVRLTVLSSQCLSSNLAVYRVQIGSGQTLETTLRGLAAYRIIVAAQANYRYALAQDAPTPSSVPPAPARPLGDPDQYVVEKLHLGEVHRLVTGVGVPVAVIDSEIDNVHPDLAGAISNRYDATGSEEKPHPHGTGMAGAIGSHQRLLGVAPGARLIAIHAFSTKATSAESTTDSILKGLDYAVTNNARIVNMSFAGPPDPSLDRAVKTASDKGLILIAAAGNDWPKIKVPLYPAAYPSVISVTATDMDDKIYSGANRSKHVAIAAPGVDILVPAPDGTYQLTTGTSVATAHVSGVTALLLERNPKLTAADIRRILTQSAKKLGPPTDYGAGLIDPLKALDLAAPKSAELPTTSRPPTVAANFATVR